MGGKSTPKAPDYTGAAEQSAQSSREVTEQQTWANRANQYTPYGSQTWANEMMWDPSTQQYLNQWTQTTNLDPTLQAALDEQMATQYERSALAGDLTSRMQNEFGTPMDWGNLPQAGQGVQAGNLTPEQLQRSYEVSGPNLDPSQRYAQNAEDALYNRWASRALPQQQMQEESLRTRLSNQGLKPGDAAYDNELAKMRMANSDALQQAQYQATIGAGQEAQRYLGMDASTRQQLTGENAALAQFGNQAATGQFGMGAQAGAQNFGQQMQSSQYQNQLRQQQLAERMQQRGWSLNEINALLSGQQVNMPNMPSYNTAGRSDAVDYSGAAQNQYQAGMDAYNAQAAQAQGIMSGITGIAGAAMSDRRLKTDIEAMCKESTGLIAYAFRYVWDAKDAPKRTGYMADEVARLFPQAIDHVGKYLRVNYAAIG